MFILVFSGGDLFKFPVNFCTPRQLYGGPAPADKNGRRCLARRQPHKSSDAAVPHEKVVHFLHGGMGS